MIDKISKYNKLYMDIAERISQMSYATRLKVGSILVRNNNIISFGWNGTPTGWDNNCENIMPDGSLKTKPEVIHAEANCLLKISRSNESSDFATLYTTVAPCVDCAKLIYQAGVAKVYYRDSYRSTDGVEFLHKSNISVDQLTN